MSGTSILYTPSPASLQTPGVMPASPYVLYDVNARQWGRQSAYWNNPRGVLSPAHVGLQGFGALGRCCKGLRGLGGCCASCAAGGPCEGAAGLGDVFETTSRLTGPYGLPAILGAGLGYILTGKWTGAVAGAIVGAGTKYAGQRASRYLSRAAESVRAQLPPASPAAVEGFGSWLPPLFGEIEHRAGDAPASAEQRAVLQLVRISVIVGLAGLGLEVYEQMQKRQPNGRRNARRRRPWKEVGRVRNARMKTKIPVATREQIEELKQLAIKNKDSHTAGLCNQALSGDRRAVRECSEMVALVLSPWRAR